MEVVIARLLVSSVFVSLYYKFLVCPGHIQFLLLTIRATKHQE